jgi:hypothetical protein
VIGVGGQACGGGEQAGEPERRATLFGSLRSLAAARLPWSFVRAVVLVLSVTVLVLVLDRIVMIEPTFDHERLDVYRLSIAYVAFLYQIAKSLSGSGWHAQDECWTGWLGWHVPKSSKGVRWCD